MLTKKFTFWRKESANPFSLFSSPTMDSSPHRDAPKEPTAPRDPQRESSDEEIVDDELEQARVAALEAQERFQALQRRSQEKVSPPVPAPMLAAAAPPKQVTPRQELRAPPPPPELPRGPVLPPPASPAPAAPAPQPAPMPTPAQAKPKGRHHSRQKEGLGVCQLRRNRRDASHLLSHSVLCQKPSWSLSTRHGKGS